MNSMSFSGTPALSARPMPSPVELWEFVDGRYTRPAPPVASTTAFAPIVWILPWTMS